MVGASAVCFQSSFLELVLPEAKEYGGSGTDEVFGRRRRRRKKERMGSRKWVGIKIE